MIIGSVSVKCQVGSEMKKKKSLGTKEHMCGKKKITSRRVTFRDSEVNNRFKCKVVGRSKKFPVFSSAVGLRVGFEKRNGLI